MNKKVYFCGSIRGGRGDEKTYQTLVSHMEETDVVLTAHVAFPERSKIEKVPGAEQLIYNQDTAWLRECDVVIAECSQVSHGVGYELAYAERFEKPVYVFLRKGTTLSAMIGGDPNFTVYFYETVEEVIAEIDRILGNA